MSRITRAAKMRSCTVRLHGCRNERDTVVFAHAPSIAKGLGLKSPDYWGAFACAHCHDKLDGRSGSLINAKAAWLPSIFETQQILFKEGLLIVA